MFHRSFQIVLNLHDLEGPQNSAAVQVTFIKKKQNMNLNSFYYSGKLNIKYIVHKHI